MGKVIKNNLEELDKLGYGGKPKVVKEKEPEKLRGKVLISKNGRIDENWQLR